MFLFYLEIVNGRYQLQFLNLPTASSNHAGGAILSLYDSFDPQISIFVRFTLKNLKNCGQSTQAFEITL